MDTQATGPPLPLSIGQDTWGGTGGAGGTRWSGAADEAEHRHYMLITHAMIDITNHLHSVTIPGMLWKEVSPKICLSAPKEIAGHEPFCF